MTDGRSIYPIPADNESMDGVLCFRVLVPNTTDWVQTFYRCLRTLARGRSWDGNTGVVVDAKEIGLAIWETADVGCNCDNGDIEQSINVLQNQVLTLVQELEQMQVVVNNYNGGGCGCGNSGNGGGSSGGGGSNFPPDWDNPYDGNLPGLPDGENQTDSEFDAWKCNASRYAVNLVSQIVSALRQLVSVGDTAYNSVLSTIQGVFQGALGVVDLPTSLFAYLGGYVFNVLSQDVASTMNQWINENESDLVDALACSDSPIGAYTSVLSVINGSVLPTAVKHALRFVFLIVPYGNLFASVEERLEVPDYGVDCGCSEYDFDFTILIKSGEPYMDSMVHSATRSGINENWGWLNAINQTSVFMGISHSGLLGAISDNVGHAVTGATLQLFGWEAVGTIEGVGGWGSNASCTDGYVHTVNGESGGVIDSDILVSCPENWYYSSVNEVVSGAGGGNRVVWVSQNEDGKSPTSGSETHVLRMRFAGSVA